MTGPSDHRGRPVGNQETSHGGHRPTPLGTSVPLNRNTRNPETQAISDAKRGQYKDSEPKQIMIDWTRPARDRLVLDSDDN